VRTSLVQPSIRPVPDRRELLAGAIAGRPLRIAVAGRGEGAFTDGATVFLPAGFDPAEKLLALALQAALVHVGAIDVEHVPRLRGRAARRFLYLEGLRAASMLSARFPGLVPRLPDGLRVAPRTGSAHSSLHLARGGAELPEPHPLLGELRPDRVLRHRRLASSGHGADREGAGRSDRESASRPPEGLVEGKLTEWIRRLLGLERTGKAGPPGTRSGNPLLLAGAVGSGARPVDRPRTHVFLAGRAREDDRPGAVRAALHPELDVKTGRYLPDWCLVHELSPRETRAVPSGEAQHLHRHLARVGLSLARVRRRVDGDDLDLDAAISWRVDVAAGDEPPGSDRLFVGLDRRARELGVLLLVDASGSTGDRGPGGRTLLAHHVDATRKLLSGFSRLGVPCGAWAFRSQGRRAVRLERLRSFRERSLHAGLGRLAALEPGGFTRLGAAIRHASTVLLPEAGTRQRLLVVISDGLAFDIDYEGRYAEADACRALEEARARGVACVCLTVGVAQAGGALGRVFGGASHASAATFDALVPRLPRLLEQELRAGGRSPARRLAGRTR